MHHTLGTTYRTVTKFSQVSAGQVRVLLFIGILSGSWTFIRAHSVPSYTVPPRGSCARSSLAPPLRGWTFQFGHECSKLEIESRRFELTARTSRPPRLGLHHQTICQTLRSTTEDMGRRVSCARAGRLGAMAYGLCSCIESSSGPTRRRASRRRRPLWSGWRRSS